MYNLPLDEAEARDWRNRGILPASPAAAPEHSHETHSDVRKPINVTYVWSTAREVNGHTYTHIHRGSLPLDAEITIPLPGGRGSATLTVAALRALLLDPHNATTGRLDTPATEEEEVTHGRT